MRGLNRVDRGIVWYFRRSEAERLYIRGKFTSTTRSLFDRTFGSFAVAFRQGYYNYMG